MIKQKYSTLIFGLLVFIFAYISFLFNGFKVANHEWFLDNQLTSEQLVLEGILHANNTQKPILGRYYREKTGTDPKYLYKFYAENNIDGDFKNYVSQYGLQLIFINFIKGNLCNNVRCFHAISVFALSAIIAALYVLVRFEFGNIPSLMFAGAYILSPWFVVFAKNLYFMPFSWIAPTLVAIFFAKYYSNKRIFFYLSSLALFALYLTNALMRYEYITAVGVSACVPIVYILIKKGHSLQDVLKAVFYNFIIFVIGFALALVIHACSLRNNINDGLEEVFLQASKRVQVTDADQVVKKFCNGNDVCSNTIKSNFNRSVFEVIGNYFIFPSFVPWSNKDFVTGLPCSSPPGCVEKLRVYIIAADYLGMVEEIFIVGFDFQALRWVLSRVSFIIFFGFSFFCAIKSEAAIKYAYFFSLLAPLSWFVLAKPHSDDHYSMNYIVWYIPFIPYSALIIGSWICSITKSKGWCKVL